MSVRAPDFFIVGAPKCGTTSLHRYLQAHPQLYMPQRKELPYLATDLTDQRPGMALSGEAYNDYFKEAGARMAGASWVMYLYSKRAAQELRAFSPEARILVLLRSPAEMLYSYHSQLLTHGLEEIENFEKALDAEADRKRGKRLPNWLPYPESCLYYTEVARYAEQLERYFDAFGRERTHVALFDDFCGRTAEVYRDALRFLGVDDQFAPSFERANPNARARNASFQRRLISPPRWAAGVFRRLPKPVQRFGRTVQERLFHMNTREAPRPPMNSETRERLIREMEPETRRLEALLGCDLSAWRT